MVECRYKMRACENALTLIGLIAEFPWTPEELELIIEICEKKLEGEEDGGCDFQAG